MTLAWIFFKQSEASISIMLYSTAADALRAITHVFFFVKECMGNSSDFGMCFFPTNRRVLIRFCCILLRNKFKKRNKHESRIEINKKKCAYVERDGSPYSPILLYTDVWLKVFSVS